MRTAIQLATGNFQPDVVGGPRQMTISHATASKKISILQMHLRIANVEVYVCLLLQVAGMHGYTQIRYWNSNIQNSFDMNHESISVYMVYVYMYCVSENLVNTIRFRISTQPYPAHFSPAPSQPSITSNEEAEEPMAPKGPSAATLSRARYKLDILNMYCRRWQWGHAGFQSHHITLCS